MSQKNDTIPLALSLIITIGLGFGGFSLFKDQIFPSQKQPTQDIRISFGEKVLTPGDASLAKKEGIQALANKNYNQAIANLEAALKARPNDPEALIFLNNARIGSTKSYTIATSVPFGKEPNSSLEILRGVAQAQNEINASGGINGVPVKIGIANDDNDPNIVEQIASNLVKNSEVLGVIGHNSSDATLAAGRIYNAGKLVAITPTSTSVKISKLSPYVFRTVPSDFTSARTLAHYMVNTLKKQNAAVFFSSKSDYSQSLKSEFTSSLLLEGGQVSREFDLSQADFSAVESLAQAQQTGAEVLMIAANAGTLDKALQVVQVNQKQLPLLGGDSVYTPKTLEIGREPAVGMVLAVPWHIDGNSQSNFPQTSQKLWSAQVNWRTALAYDATRALSAALARNPTRAGIQQVLVSSDFSTTGASGTIRFLQSGDRNAPVQLVNIAPGSRSRTGYDFVPLPISAAKIRN
ncbi:MAG: ABC transporter substrate-binding protein [Goleter apudmare HA4340-LM2]|jgi:branched-chain amino acid transport system substrate-binding protein|nr:ABC transporter substrate-binding protein [Goleter apudmare HA4340-LM2]